MNIIRLHGVDVAPHWMLFNCDHIVAVLPLNKGCVVVTVSGTFSVAESANEVWELIK